MAVVAAPVILPCWSTVNVPTDPAAPYVAGVTAVLSSETVKVFVVPPT